MADKAPMPFRPHLGMLLDYDPATGALNWRSRTPDMFKSGKQSALHNCAIWNGKFAGRPALNSPDAGGYLTGHLNGRPVKAHRIIWELVYGKCVAEIDHINGNPADNRLCNLREVSHAENGRNLKLKATNKTGVCGVYPRRSGRWYARITVGRKQIDLGTFDKIEAAIAARKAAEIAYGFHANHGIVR